MSKSNLDVESKFAKALLTLRKIRPFYSSIYEILDRKESKSIDTMGVTSTSLIYNGDFVDRISFEELLFTDLHEVAHIALMHTSRVGNRDKYIFNIACDLYVNKLLSEEFSLYPGKTVNNIKMPYDILFCSSIDLDKECVEGIYECLNKQAEEQGYYEGANIIHLEYSGTNHVENNYDKFFINIERKNNSWVKLKKNNKSENSQHGSTNETNADSNSDSNLDEQNNNSGNSQQGCNSEPNDLLDSNNDSTLDEQDNKRIISEAITKAELQKEAGTSSDNCLLQIKAEKSIKSYIDWKKLLMKYCIAVTSKDSSFISPDKRMYYQSAIYPGQSLDETNTLKNVKICFDVSGSISKSDIARFYGQVNNILKKFKVKAEVIYWDTEVSSTNELKNIKDIDNLQISGGGGTQPKCIFEYFDSNKCKVKPVVTVIFTDGFIGKIDNDTWKKKYKDTIWVVTNNGYELFEPPFGKVTFDKY